MPSSRIRSETEAPGPASRSRTTATSTRVSRRMLAPVQAAPPQSPRAQARRPEAARRLIPSGAVGAPVTSMFGSGSSPARVLSRLRRPGARAFARSHRLGAALVVLLLLGISTTGVPLGPTPELRAPARPPTPSLPSPAVAAATGPTPANATGYPAGVWTNATNATGPSPRQGAAMVFVPWANEFVLFGGWYRTMSNFQSTLLNDTWTFGNGVWTNITATAGAAPSPREGAALIADPVTQTLFLLGGRGYGANCSGTPGFAVCNQSIYEFVSGVWLRSGIPLPASLTSANLTDLVGSFFPPANAIVLVGTTAATTSDGWGGLAWSYQGGNWTTAVAGVPDVYGAGFAYVPGLNESVL